jgi:hypothetical protein
VGVSSEYEFVRCACTWLRVIVNAVCASASVRGECVDGFWGLSQSDDGVDECVDDRGDECVDARVNVNACVDERLCTEG